MLKKVKGFTSLNKFNNLQRVVPLVIGITFHTMRLTIGVILIAALLMLTGASTLTREKSTGQYVSNFENVLGTSLELKINASSTREAERAETVALDEIKRISKILSGYDQDSEFSHWSATQNHAVPVSQELFEVLSLFDEWKQRTNGALDASAETVSQVWKAAAKKQVLPTSDELKAAVEQTQQAHWKLDYENRTATKLNDAPLILNSFTKSYIIDKAVDAAMSSAKVKAIVMNVGGDIVVRGDLDETIALMDPRVHADNAEPSEQLHVSNRAVATSGNYKRGFQIGDQWFSHIVDPRTGEPVQQVISATVIAPEATDAGALATSFNVLTLEESKMLAKTIPGVEYLVITKEGERLESDGWSSLEIKDESPEITQASGKVEDQKLWDPQYEMVVDFEIATFQYSRRPFVAVWIENKDKAPVRNLAIWYNRDRWIPELRRWYRMNWEKAIVQGSSVHTLASPTRMPGKYTLVWDGKNDEGNFVEPGMYTVYIEAAREHGTYQIISQDMELTGKPNQINLKGNVEIASASIDYRKKQ